MRISTRIQNILLELICQLYILLFIYAALSKLLDFNHFHIQLGKSPVLGSFADLIVLLVPAIEIILALLLFFQKTRYYSLLGASNLMVMFSAYIVIILNWSSFIPCSCGGILSEMGWTEHLVFNIFFVLLGFTGAVLQMRKMRYGNDNDKTAANRMNRRLFVTVVGSMGFSVIFVVVLFLLSERESHRNNGFVRRYPHSPISMVRGWKLPYNSYYIAGIEGKDVFMGNLVAPSHLLRVVMDEEELKTIRLTLNNSEGIAFKAPRVEVRDPYFYLFDGDVAVGFKGLIQDWKGDLVWKGQHRFLQFQPVQGDTVLVSGLHLNQSNIGLIGKGLPQFPAMPQLLQKQSDEIFDTDGMLLYNSDLERLVFVYYYRNKFVVSDLGQQNHYQGSTIDTIARPVLEIAYDDGGRIRTLAKQPVFVHMQACTSGRYLFIKSNRLGRYESEDMLEQASIIDVYDLQRQTYEFSFYLNDYEGESIKSFSVQGDRLLGITDRHLVLYRLLDTRFDLSPLPKK